jgi:hypothetical protein
LRSSSSQPLIVVVYSEGAQSACHGEKSGVLQRKTTIFRAKWPVFQGCLFTIRIIGSHRVHSGNHLIPNIFSRSAWLRPHPKTGYFEGGRGGVFNFSGLFRPRGHAFPRLFPLPFCAAGRLFCANGFSRVSSLVTPFFNVVWNQLKALSCRVEPSKAHEARR